MVTITNYKPCVSQDGKEFFALTLQGDVTVSQSENGNFYLTANKASLPTSFNEIVCKTLIGKQLSGSIQKVPCESFEYTNQDGETVTLNSGYQYSPKEEGITMKQGLNPVAQQQSQILFMPIAGQKVVATA